MVNSQNNMLCNGADNNLHEKQRNGFLTYVFALNNLIYPSQDK